eukprot:CAMPEP_0116877046 /NCGR_PEP_ID=MMETSP0463-20121206/8883_1 /TAXON_ID=181622 /ORGANISM="Strombidinopsis sp, Strain SopsisLIS2011" /LENGTH=33 /DNA_ID= /DNA_START= /DNA_END= /DNA_ORIENTATION=
MINDDDEDQVEAELIFDDSTVFLGTIFTAMPSQ